MFAKVLCMEYMYFQGPSTVHVFHLLHEALVLLCNSIVELQKTRYFFVDCIVEICNILNKELLMPYYVFIYFMRTAFKRNYVMRTNE